MSSALGCAVKEDGLELRDEEQASYRTGLGGQAAFAYCQSAHDMFPLSRIPSVCMDPSAVESYACRFNCKFQATEKANQSIGRKTIGLFPSSV